MIMNMRDAEQHALGYAAGREDASSTRTVAPGKMPGFMAFADAYAKAWDRYNREVVWFVPNARDCYDAWQASGGTTVYRLGLGPASLLARLAGDGDAAAARALGLPA
jgi:hypothetical protein